MLHQAKTRKRDMLLGTVLDGKYRLEEMLGKGGAATVYRASQTGGGPDMAVKVLNPLDEVGFESVQKRIRRLRREAVAISNLKHRATIRLVDFGQTPRNRPYLVLELLRGESLLERLRRVGPIEPEELARITIEVAGSLAEAHAYGIVHRDVKPGNIMLVRSTTGGRERIKLVDFGAARLDRNRHNRMTAVGTTLGSAPYMSPEQIRGEEITPQADLYGLGVTLYEALTGELPFKGDYAELMSQHSFEPPPRLRVESLSARRLAAWQALLDALLAKTPQQRPERASHVARAAQYLAGSGGLGRSLVGIGAAAVVMAGVVAAVLVVAQ